MLAPLFVLITTMRGIQRFPCAVDTPRWAITDAAPEIRAVQEG